MGARKTLPVLFIRKFKGGGGLKGHEDLMVGTHNKTFNMNMSITILGCLLFAKFSLRVF